MSAAQVLAIGDSTPTGILIGYYEPGSDEWAQARDSRLGGSEIAAVLGLSKWESPFSLWHRKAGALGPQPDNPEMDAGRRLEPAICQKFADNHPELVMVRTGATFVHRERPWQCASPDGLLAPPGSVMPTAGLEAKLALWPDEWGEPGTDQIPPYYLAQVRWYLDTLGLDLFYLEVFVAGCLEFREYVIRADAADQAFLRGRGLEFLDSVAACRRPALDGSSATYEAVRALHPDIDPVDVEIKPALAARYGRALAWEKRAASNKRKAASAVLDRIGRGRRATLAGQPVAMRVPGRGDNPPFLRPARSNP